MKSGARDWDRYAAHTPGADKPPRTRSSASRAIAAARATAERHGRRVYVILGKTGLFVSSERHGGEVIYEVHSDGHVRSLR